MTGAGGDAGPIGDAGPVALTDPVRSPVDWRARSARTLSRLPQRCIEHQRRDPGREVSTNTS